ncbi:Deoxyribodipyrimidine photo-lyase, partial [Fasciola gigantica]
MMTLYQFINARLCLYDTTRNDPTKDATSNLSPWFHFGHVAPQRALLEVHKLRSAFPKPVDAFIEETFIRRELSDNFCHYNPNYDSLKGAYQWAQETLLSHERDKRKPAYTDGTLEEANTNDDLWNAAQRQLLRTGKIHGFLRMYWAKKILEWHREGPAAALKLALLMNDKYSLDGTDPNGFVGVMWSICGVHDQGWAK